MKPERWLLSFDDGPRIRSLEIMRETKTSYYVRSGAGAPQWRLLKRDPYRKTYPAWADAHAELMRVYRNSVEWRARGLKTARQQLRQVQEMVAPKAD